MPAAITLFSVGVLFITVGAFTQVLNIPVGMWLTELAIFGAIPLMMLRLFGFAPFRTSGVAAFTLPGLAFGFLIGVVNFFAIAMPVQWSALHLFPKVVVQIFDSSQLFRGLSGPDLLFTTLAVSLAAPLCEEICFRGLFNRALMETVRPWAAILVGAVVFSAFHLDPVGFAARFMLGALFGWLAWKSGSVWPGIGAHAGNNTTSMVLYLLSPDSDDDVGSGKQVALTFLVGTVVLVALLQLPRKFPALLSAKQPAETVPVGTKDMLRPILYWVGAVAFTISATFALDRRGTELGLIDAKHGVRFDNPKDPEAKQLIELRQRARRGEIPVEDYEKRRKELAKQHPMFDLGPTSKAGAAPGAGLPEKPSESSKAQ